MENKHAVSIEANLKNLDVTLSVIIDIFNLQYATYEATNINTNKLTFVFESCLNILYDIDITSLAIA